MAKVKEYMMDKETKESEERIRQMELYYFEQQQKMRDKRINIFDGIEFKKCGTCSKCGCKK